MLPLYTFLDINGESLVIKLRAALETRPLAPRRYRLFRVVFLLVLAGLAALLVERWRGQLALSLWKHRMAAKGEVFEVSRIWPQPSAQGRAFSNQLDCAVAQLPQGLSQYAGQISGIVVEEPGVGRRGSQEPSPNLGYTWGGTNRLEHGSWVDLEMEIREAQPALWSLRKILSSPPSDPGYDFRLRSEKLSIPNFVNVRRAAQALQAASLFDLHRGNLAAAKDNLVALAAFTRLYADDPTLVNYMIRVAVLGLSIETAWDAVQAEGWTDTQLAELQQAFGCNELLAQMPRTMEAERALLLFEWDWISSHSYMALVARYQRIYEALGRNTSPAVDVLATRYYREWVFHPLWKFAWAGQEQLEYLENAQPELEVLREAVKTGSWKQLNRRMESFHGAYRPPWASWRFYLELPFADHIIGSTDTHQYPYPNFTRAWLISMKNLTLCQMLTAAISVKRYESRHGKPPSGLEALVPELMASLPRDFMDGQPLRYKVRSDGSYCLYSVAEDAHDDQGSAVPPADDHQPPSAWNGRDWVWPRAAPAAPTNGVGLAAF